MACRNVFKVPEYLGYIYIHVYPKLKDTYMTLKCLPVKGKDYCPIEIIKGLTDKGQFHYLTKLKGPQVCTAQFLPLR